MRRGSVVATAFLLAFAAFAFQAVQLPGRVLACSCIGPPPPLAETAAQDQGVAIVAGTVGRALPDRTPIAVEAWFHGANPSEVLWVTGGTQMATSCDVFMSAGQRRLLVLTTSGGGLYSTNSCMAGGVLGTLDGDALLAEATAAFGTPQAPPSPEPEPQAPVDLSPWLGSGLIWAAAAFGVGLLLFGVVVLVARRRPSA